MSAIPVIKIKHKDGYCLINDFDFDESLHERYQESGPDPTPINLNTAKKAELVSLTGVGSKTADEIIKARPFDSLETAIAEFPALENLLVEI